MKNRKIFHFIFSGHSVKFRDVALRGAWTSDGLEFNFGDIGHATTTSTPVDYFTRTNPDGSVSCFIGATEWASGTTWRVEIKLAPDKAFFTTRSWWYNGTPVEQEMYHWINAGFRAPGNLEFIFPGTHYIGHRGEYDTWPVDSLGHKISFYEHNNFGSMKSYPCSWTSDKFLRWITGMIIIWVSVTIHPIMRSWVKKHGPGAFRAKD